MQLCVAGEREVCRINRVTRSGRAMASASLSEHDAVQQQAKGKSSLHAGWSESDVIHCACCVIMQVV